MGDQSSPPHCIGKHPAHSSFVTQAPAREALSPGIASKPRKIGGPIEEVLAVKWARALEGSQSGHDQRAPGRDFGHERTEIIEFSHRENLSVMCHAETKSADRFL